MKTKTNSSVIVSTASAPVRASGYTLGLDLGDQRHFVCVLSLGRWRRQRYESAINDPECNPLRNLPLNRLDFIGEINDSTKSQPVATCLLRLIAVCVSA